MSKQDKELKEQAFKFLKNFVSTYQDGEYYYKSPETCIKAWARKLIKQFPPRVHYEQQIQEAVKAERECKRCKGDRVIPVSLIYGKINKVNERLCPNCNGTGKVTVERAIKEKME